MTTFLCGDVTETQVTFHQLQRAVLVPPGALRTERSKRGVIKRGAPLGGGRGEVVAIQFIICR
jgi:hypothetical protein